MDSKHNRFALVGVGGYIAPRHLRAIRSVGGILLTACDVSDSVGIIDSYFPEADFTTDPDLFFGSLRHCRPDYLTVCTPNYLHCRHTLEGLDAGAHVICEKPIVLTCDEHRLLSERERTSGRCVFPILQMRLHPEVARIREKLRMAPSDRVHDIDLTYIAPRGRWYAASWKGRPEKSGGVLTNIGVHFVDLLHWLFGRIQRIVLHCSAPDCIAGVFELDRAQVRFLLSVNAAHAPQGHAGAYRSFVIDGDRFDFSEGFADLHDLSYAEILAGRGFSIDDTLDAVRTVEAVRTLPVSPLAGSYHPMLNGLPGVFRSQKFVKR